MSNKQFIVGPNGQLEDTNRPEIKVYPSIAAATAALENGDLQEGELVTTEFVDGSADIALAAGLLADAVRVLNERVDEIEGGESGLSEKISSSATSTNKCPSASEVSSTVSSAIGDEVTARNSAISTAVGNEANARNTAITNAVNDLDVAQIGDNTTYIKNITETDGKISAITGTMPTFTLVGDVLTITTGA